ncbi:uncharacterized protein LOC136029318 isoform X2 [Artemia franciscana]|uniref:uncharacterized protein LOC136029318 isoform X2 n=1 Tax=Artemia franciscana TaxID=6661 RepID=UPI0032DABCC0
MTNDGLSICKDCRKVRRDRLNQSLTISVLCIVIFLDFGMCASLSPTKEDLSLLDCYGRCTQKCASYCHLLKKKSQAKRKLLCDNDSYRCDEGCKQACSFFGFIQNETFEKGTKKFDFGKVENKISGKKEKKQRKIVNQEKQVTTAFPPHAPEVPSIKVAFDWRISLVAVKRLGSIVQGSFKWEERQPSRLDVYTADPVLSYLGITTGKYKLHWSCEANNLEGQLVTDATSATVSMWPDCRVLVKVILVGYGLESPSIVADTWVENSILETTTIQNSVRNEDVVVDSVKSPIVKDMLPNLLMVLAGLQLAIICVILALRLICSNEKSKEIPEIISDNQAVISCIVVK